MVTRPGGSDRRGGAAHDNLEIDYPTTEPQNNEMF